MTDRSALQYHRRMCSREYAVDLHTRAQYRTETRATAAKRFSGIEGLRPAICQWVRPQRWRHVNSKPP